MGHAQPHHTAISYGISYCTLLSLSFFSLPWRWNCGSVLATHLLFYILEPPFRYPRILHLVLGLVVSMKAEGRKYHFDGGRRNGTTVWNHRTGLALKGLSMIFKRDYISAMEGLFYAFQMLVSFYSHNSYVSISTGINTATDRHVDRRGAVGGLLAGDELLG